MATRAWVHCLTTVNRMMSIPENQRRYSSEYAELRTSLNDWRASAALARGYRPDQLDRNGFLLLRDDSADMR